MSSVSSAAVSQIALTQTLVRTDINTRLLKMAQEMGSQQALELIQQVVDAAETVSSANRANGRLDVCV